DYRGEIRVILANLGSEPVTLARGDRIAQLVIAPVVRARLERAEALPGTERNGGGFGSTGKEPRTDGYNRSLRVTGLASGSGGNACVVEAGPTRVLVDAGLSAREIERRLESRGMRAESITALFLTHEHNDHSSGAPVFVRRWDCPVYATAGTAAAIGLEGDLFTPYIRVYPARDGRIGELGFRALSTPHDAA